MDVIYRNAFSKLLTWMSTEESANLGEALSKLVAFSPAICMRATGGADANEIVLKASLV